MRLRAAIAALTGAYWVVLGNTVPNPDDAVDSTCLSDSTSSEVATTTTPETSCSTTSLQQSTTSTLAHSTANSASTASTGTKASTSPTVVTITITTSPASSVDFTSSNLPVSISSDSSILDSSRSQPVSTSSSCTEDLSNRSPTSGTSAESLETGRSPAAVTVSPDINSVESITATDGFISGTTKVLTLAYPDGLSHTTTKFVTITIPDITWNPAQLSTEGGPTITTVTIPAGPTAAEPSPYEVTYTLTPDDVFSAAFTGTVTLTPSSPVLTVDQGHPAVSSPVETAVTMTYTAFVSGSTLVTTVTEYPLLESGTPVVTVLTPHPISNTLGSIPIVPLTITLTSSVVTTPTPRASNALPEASHEVPSLEPNLGATTVTETAVSTATIFETESFDLTPSSPAPSSSTAITNTEGSVVQVTYTIPGQAGGDASTYTVSYTAPAFPTHPAGQGGISDTSGSGFGHVTTPSSSSTDGPDSSETPYTVTVTPVDVSGSHNPVTITYTLHATTSDTNVATPISTDTQTVTGEASSTEDSGYGAPTSAQSSIDNGDPSSASTADSYGPPTVPTPSAPEGTTGQPSFSTPTDASTTSDSGGYQYGSTTTGAPTLTWSQATTPLLSSPAAATAVVSKVTLTETVSLGPHSSTVLSFTTDVTLVAGSNFFDWVGIIGITDPTGNQFHQMVGNMACHLRTTYDGVSTFCKLDVNGSSHIYTKPWNFFTTYDRNRECAFLCSQPDSNLYQLHFIAHTTAHNLGGLPWNGTGQLDDVLLGHISFQQPDTVGASWNDSLIVHLTIFDDVDFTQQTYR
ncbi:uncharacterized protein C8A04DRAFT_31719 [Dichotomopilus funicola]|uniref:Uncharacterized protein n=1 Tax=Dichotomopilus funicola TaxID=1934379 RepID=A0AAN6UX47_9PEZI|nr:hypothetical protein C8A04DRAFT_31719 [Dichotomopilus funicola]